MNFLVDETHKAYEAGYIELQHMIQGLRRSVSVKETIKEILCIYKDIYDYIKNPNMMKTNDVCRKMQISFLKVCRKLDELKAMFEEKSKPSSSKKG